MEPETKEEGASKGFGKVVEELHNKQRLSALRTYQGDMAEFIKEKNQSVISVKLKEKERKEKREEELINSGVQSKKAGSKSNFQVNLTMLALSITLLAAGASAFFYVFSFITNRPSTQIKIETDLIPYNSVTTLANVSKETLREEMAKLPPPNGIEIIKISDQNGKLLSDTVEFFDFLEVGNSLSLRRTLGKNFVLGLAEQKGESSRFLIFTINDFGIAFSSMLAWENSLAQDLAFLRNSTDTDNPEQYSWQDVITGNKDVRSLTNKAGISDISYTFLDRKTILIAEDISIIANLAAAYASRSVAR